MRPRSRTPRPDWPEARRAPEPKPKAAHAAELEEAVASASCPVQLIPRGVSGLVEADVAGTRWAWLWRTSAPVREARHMALAIHRGPSFSLAPGCARMVAADGRRRDD
jgi:hypothetical protein